MAAPGWHGKLPTLGDFASRRLDAGFIEPWDTWLAEGIAWLQKTDGSAWLQAYLDSPSWRFLLMPGVLPGAAGQQAWVGVLMPSVDRVGRYFPFTIAQPLDGLPASAADRQKLSDWLDRLDDIAVDALYDDWTVERLEEALQAAAVPELVMASGSATPTGSNAVHIDHRPASETLGLSDVLVARAIEAFGPQAKRLALWLGSAKGEQRRVVTSTGLPREADFGALLGKDTPLELLGFP